MKFTIEEFKNYLMKQDSMGDMLFNLTEENVMDANEIDDIQKQLHEELKPLYNKINELKFTFKKAIEEARKIE